jgi:N-acetylglucosaminyldiphosphoundecaprenol N-acetyl-beta-D-mannosaminyltransferase
MSTYVTPERIRVGRLPVDMVSFEGALDVIDQLVRSGNGGTVFTPNVDHIVMAEHNQRFQTAYHAASLSLVDGTPVLWASRLLGKPLPAKVSGSDLIMPLMERAAERDYRVYFLGGNPGVAEMACEKLRAALPRIQIVGTDDSRIDVSGDLSGSDEIVERIRNARPDLVLVALGAPKQEIWSHGRLDLLKPAVLIGVGASLDFVAGIQKRAPRWMSSAGVEWLYRLAQEPRRLAGRYLLRDPEFCLILLRQLMGGGSAVE